MSDDPVSTDKLSQAMANVDKTATADQSGGVGDATTTNEAAAALSTTNTPQPAFTSHTTNLSKLLSVENARVLERILEIDAEVAKLLAERADAVAVYTATVNK